MKKEKFKGWLAVSIILGSIFIDQIIKIVVKTTMYCGESIHVTNWFYIYFVENPGMAFGMEILPKAIQTTFRILCSVLIIWLICRLVKNNYKSGYIVCVSFILAGALGNIIDSIFYGVLFAPSSSYEISTFVPLETGYADWLYGKVVDMFYFPLCEFNWPIWMPFIGGTHFIFFSPIFNFADAIITCGMIIFILFYRKEFEMSFCLAKNEMKNLIKRIGTIAKH